MKAIAALVLCFLAGGVVSSYAQTQPAPLLEKKAWDIGLQVSYLTYNEHLVKTKGPKYGLFGSFTYHNKIMLKAELRASYGGVEWDGITLAGQPFHADNSLNVLGEARVLGGYDIPLFTASVLTPYLGIGLRYLNNDVEPRPYERETYYIYSPLGIAYLTALGNGWSLGGTAEYDYLWWGYQTSHPMDILPGLENDLVVHQRNGYGLRGSLTLAKKYKKLAFEGGPFVNYWNIKELNPQTFPYTGSPTGFLWQEPGNNSLEVGIKLGVKF